MLGFFKKKQVKGMDYIESIWRKTSKDEQHKEILAQIKNDKEKILKIKIVSKSTNFEETTLLALIIKNAKGDFRRSPFTGKAILEEENWSEHVVKEILSGKFESTEQYLAALSEEELAIVISIIKNLVVEKA